VIKTKLKVNELEIVLYSEKDEEFISLTDMAKFRDSQRTNYIIQNWMRTRSTIEFIGLWEQLHNPNFKSIEFDAFKNEAGSNSFTLTPKKWIEATNAISNNLFIEEDLLEFLSSTTMNKDNFKIFILNKLNKY
jgi:hypothetical protein